MNRPTEILPNRPPRHGAAPRVTACRRRGAARGLPMATTRPAADPTEASATSGWLGRLLPFRLIDDD